MSSGNSIWAVVVYIDFYNRALLDVLAPHYSIINVATYLTC